MSLLESGDPWFAAARTLLLGVAVALAIGPGGVRLLARRLLKDEDRAQRISLAAFWGVVAIFGVVAVARLLGGSAAQAGLMSAGNRLFTTLPDMVVALVLIVVGSVVAAAARVGVARSMAQRRPRYADTLAMTASVAILTVALLLAARQIGVQTMLLDSLVIAAGGAVLLALGLAAGLGGRGYAEAVASGRHAEAILTVGDLIEVDGRRGRVLKLGATSVRLGLPGGTVAEIPNPLLLSSTVVVFEHEETAVPSAGSTRHGRTTQRRGGATAAGEREKDVDSYATMVVQPEVDDEAPTRAFPPAGVGAAPPTARVGTSAEAEPLEVLDRAELARRRAEPAEAEQRKRPAGEPAPSGTLAQRDPAALDGDDHHPTDIFSVEDVPPRRRR